ncbi:ATP-binding protein [Candidatus Micrarchaeota archaeon]|nr:ATP-binding protein [Candidatus Micrarchaeota archaeon]
MENSNGAVKPPNPFNPGSPIDPADFIGRASELENFRQKLRQTAEGSLASMAVAGGYGVGKTSFLHKCKTIAEEQNALAIYFSLNEVDELSRETLAKVLIQRIQEKVREEVILKRLSSQLFNLNLLERVRIKTETGVEISLVREPKGDAYPNLHSALSAAWNALKGSKTAIVFLVDEARVLEKNRAELILYLRAVLEQLQVSRVPVMVVPAGKLTITGPTGSGFSPLVRTFPPAVLENFSEAETKAFICRKLRQVNFVFADSAFPHVFSVTEGHPFVLSAYLSAAYSKMPADETELKEVYFKATDLVFVKYVLAPFFSRFYDQAGPFSKRILGVMAKDSAGETTLSKLTGALKKEANELSPHLAKLVQDGAIVRIDRGKYKLFHHLLGQYIREKSGFGVT